MLRQIVKKLLERKGYEILPKTTVRRDFVELLPHIVSDLEKCVPFTMTSWERLQGIAIAVKYLNANKIQGDFVECGVWAGGSIGAACLVDEMSSTRDYWLFDTFNGMTKPTFHDGATAVSEFMRLESKNGYSDWCNVSVEDVKENLSKLGLSLERAHFVKGDVLATLLEPTNLPRQIALLRLDTDWYESTKIELEVLYELITPGGVLIIDDFGYWGGSRKAVEEFFQDSPQKPLLFPIDHDARMVVKPTI
jgi:hypothetical protein